MRMIKKRTVEIENEKDLFLTLTGVSRRQLSQRTLSLHSGTKINVTNC